MDFGTHATPRTTPRRALVALALAGGLAIAGCGSSVAASAAATSAPAASVAASAAPASDAPGGAGACGGNVAAAIKEHVGGTDISEIRIIGGCHMAFIATTLAATDVKGGLAICDKAAEVAYTDGVSSITVAASDAKELAIGLKDAQCIGEP